MSRAPVEFELYDADGNAHEYVITPHPASEALKLVWAMIRAAAQPLARVLEGNIVQLYEAFTGEEDITIEALLEDLDIDLADSAKDLFEVLFSTGEEWVTRELLNHTTRDAQPLKAGTRKGDFAFDMAYQANYGEMLEACYKSVQVNRFLSLFRTSLNSIANIAIEEVEEATTPAPDSPAPSASIG